MQSVERTGKAVVNHQLLFQLQRLADGLRRLQAPQERRAHYLGHAQLLQPLRRHLARQRRASLLQGSKTTN